MKNSERLGETRRGCKPHGQRGGASRTGGVSCKGRDEVGGGGDFGGETWRFWREGVVGAVRIIE